MSIKGMWGGRLRDESKHGTCKCQFCGKEFDYYKSDLNRRVPKYCSSYCYHTASRVPLRNCEWCGKQLSRKQSTTGHRFCSNECVYAYKRARPRNVTLGKDGYRYVWMSDGSSVKEHIFVMEQHIGRKLLPGECVHHIDGSRSNNDISNLMLMTIGEHPRLHRQQEIEAGKPLFGRKS